MHALNQCNGSGMIYSESSNEFLEFRIRIQIPPIFLGEIWKFLNKNLHSIIKKILPIICPFLFHTSVLQYTHRKMFRSWIQNTILNDLECGLVRGWCGGGGPWTSFPQLSVVRIFSSYPWSGFSPVIRGPDFPQLSVVRIFPNYPWSGFSPVIRGPDFSNCPSSGMFDWGNNGKDRKFENTLTLNTIVCTTVLFLQFVYFFFRHNVLHFEKNIFFQNSSWDLQEVAN